jgi:very-short-patch-repair endonuclease
VGVIMRAKTSIARKLRNNLTDAEKHLWYELRMKNLGVKFRRQVAIGKYIVDFACFDPKVVIEIDGGQHANSQTDLVRDSWLASQGFKILRFWNNEVLENRDGVLLNIKDVLTPSLNPSPQGGGK